MSDENRSKAPVAPSPVADGGDSRTRARREITSAELFRGGREIHTRHLDAIYTLRQTNKGKLILTK
jgi:hemin uptake protein HemP